MAVRHDAAAGRPWKCRFIDWIGRFIEWGARAAQRNDIRMSVKRTMFHVRQEESIAPFLRMQKASVAAGSARGRPDPDRRQYG
jgi:hypothetical protein